LIRGWVCCFCDHLGVSNLLRDWRLDRSMKVQVEDNSMPNSEDRFNSSQTKQVAPISTVRSKQIRYYKYPFFCPFLCAFIFYILSLILFI
jgi:hypothetical protein